MDAFDKIFVRQQNEGDAGAVVSALMALIADPAACKKRLGQLADATQAYDDAREAAEKATAEAAAIQAEATAAHAEVTRRAKELDEWHTNTQASFERRERSVGAREQQFEIRDEVLRRAEESFAIKHRAYEASLNNLKVSIGA